MKLSIILPCYNVAKYLPRCFDSILSQEVDFEYEIIAVNDASTDNTLEILQQYSLQNNNIRIVDKVNEYHKSKNINRDTKEFKLYLFINMMQSCINNINQNTPKQIAYIVKYFSSQQRYEQAVLQYLKKNNQNRFTFRQIYNTALFTCYKYHLFNIAAFFESLRVKRLRKQSITNTFYD